MPGNKRAKIRYTEESFEEALEAVKNGRMSIRAASKHFKVQVPIRLDVPLPYGMVPGTGKRFCAPLPPGTNVH
jgi:hypothetical protein